MSAGPFKCPRCGSRELTACETVAEVEVRTVSNGWLEPERVDHEPAGTIRWDATCGVCDHKWVPRRATIDAATRDDE